MLTTEEIPVAAPGNETPGISAIHAVRPKPDTRPVAPVLGRSTQSDKMNWPSTIVFSIFHIGAIAALFFFTWKALICAVVLYVMAINMGIGMCYHRLLTHRGYRTPKWVEYVLTTFACLALEGGPMFWVATHRVHHQNSDQPGDPHTRMRVHGGHTLAGS